jgi:hypothetical protein
MIVVLGVGISLFLGVLRWGRKPGGDASLTEIRGFSPNELDSLKAQGLLSDDEAKRIRAIVAERTVEAMRRREADTGPPPDLNTLLGEAERYHREMLIGAEETETEMKSESENAPNSPPGEKT